MAKIKLGNRPKSFKHPVTFKMLDGTEGSIGCTFRYRTKTEFGAFLDSIFDAAQMEKPKDEKFSMGDLMERTRNANADYLLAVLDAWDLDEGFDRAALQQLADEVPAAVIAIMEAYRLASTEGRLGN